LAAGRILRKDLELAPPDVTLEPARPKELVRFYDRVAGGRGRFISRAEIETREPRRITQMIGEIPGTRLALVPGAAGGVRDMVWFGRQVRTDEYGRPIPCAPALYLDGSRLTDGGPGAIAPSLDDLVSPAEVEGVEAYDDADSVPAEFAGSRAGCGVIVIWTRGG
jgi:hypothetical protein